MHGAAQAPRGGEVRRTTVDLTAYPDLVVIYLGMRVRTPRGLGTLRSLGKQIQRSAAAQPDGLLRHEMLWYSLLPARRRAHLEGAEELTPMVADGKAR
jgi:hypothetical protein